MKFKSKYTFEDYRGKPIYYLTPISESNELAKDSSKQWNFMCVCGKIITTPPYRVISGHIKSCGCMRYKNIKHSEHDRTNSQKTNPENFIGKRCERLTVIGYKKPEGKGRIKLKCLCDCGNITYIYPYQFSAGAIKSCGCAKFGHSECHKGNTSRRTHNLSENQFYGKWERMKSRCYNTEDKNYHNYGGRGITICEEWKDSPVEFIKWCESTYPQDGKKYSIDRKDNNGNYCPENCRWATQMEQMHNVRYNRNITLFGETKCVTQWCRELNISHKNLYKKVKRGVSFEEAILSMLEYKKSCGMT